MAAKSSSASNLPWFWVIEFLSSCKQVDTSLLNDLILRAPDISDPLAKNARERVTLRCLEDLFCSSTSMDGSPALDSKIEFDLSENCEEVIQRMACEIPMSNLRMARKRLLKWNLDPFIMHKRASLPTCFLQQLKDTNAEGSLSFLASSKERSQPDHRDSGDINATGGALDVSGANSETVVDKGNLITPTPEIENDILLENALRRNVLPSKRDRNGLVGENPAGHAHENQVGMYNDRDHPNAKKLKENSSCTSLSLEKDEVSLHGDELLEESSERVRHCTGVEGPDSAEEFQGGCFRKRGFSVEGRDKSVASTRLGEKNEVDDQGEQHNQPLALCNDDKIHQAASQDGHLQGDVDEAKVDNEPLDRRTITGDEIEHGFEANVLNNVPSNGPCQNTNTDGLKNDMDQRILLDTSSDSDEYNDEEIDIARKKEIFFSQCMSETAELTELNICMKCNKLGRLLLCSACPLAVHEHCLGSSASFDDLGDFYCPFCGYLRAVSKYLEAKKKASLARKELSAFIGVGIQHEKSNPSKGSYGEEWGQFRKNGQLEESILVKDGGENACAEESNLINGGDHAGTFDPQHGSTSDRGQAQRTMKNSSLENHVNCANLVDLQRRSIEVERKTDGHVEESNVVNAEDCARTFDPQTESTEGKWQADGEMKESSQANDGDYVNMVTPQHGSAAKMQEAECSTPCVGEHLYRTKVIAVIDETLCVVNEGKDEGIIMIQEPEAPELQNHVQADPKEVLQCVSDPTQGLASTPKIIDSGEISEDENDISTASPYSMRMRRQEKHYTYPAIPLLRRKKVPWTEAEEEMLKEGVQRFSRPHEKSIPWKMILEFGDSVFLKGRTAIDLKDKWRNICKRNSK